MALIKLQYKMGLGPPVVGRLTEDFLIITDVFSVLQTLVTLKLRVCALCEEKPNVHMTVSVIF